MNQASSAAAARERVRTTERVASSSGPIARKSFEPRRRLLRLAELLGLRQSAARREFEMLCELRERGVPVPEPVAVELSADSRGPDVVVTRWIEGSRTLAAVVADAADVALGPRERRLIARRLGELVRALHAAGVVHRDLHASNVLVQPDGTLALIDFHRARRRLSRSAQERDFADLAIHFLSRSSVVERLRFLRAALPTTGRSRREQRARIREISARSLRRRRRFFAHHEERCRGGGRAFVPVRLGSMTGVARREWAEPVIAALGDDPWEFAPRAGRLLHRGGDAEVWRVDRADLPFPLLVKRFHDRGMLRRLFRGSRAARAWLQQFRLEMAQLPGPRPLLFIEGSRLAPSPRSLLVTECLTGHEMLHEHVARLGAGGGAGPAGLSTTLRSLAADLARLHDESLSHRDLKAENLLVARAGGRALCVDVDGMRRCSALTPAIAARDLMRLSASFRDERTVSWRDRGRFLAAYRRARLLDRPELRELWRLTKQLTEQKWRSATPR